MRVALQHLPVFVAGNHGDVLDVPVGLEQAADGLVAQVMKMQVLDAEIAADATETGTDRAAVIGKNEPVDLPVRSACNFRISTGP